MDDGGWRRQRFLPAESAHGALLVWLLQERRELGRRVTTAPVILCHND